VKTLRFFLIASFVTASAAAADRVSVRTFGPGEAYAPPAELAPARTSRAYVRTVEARDGLASVELPVSGAPRLLIWTVAAGAPVATSVRTPGGRALAAQETRAANDSLRRVPLDIADLGLDVPGALEAIEVREAEAGTYHLEVESAGASAVAVVVAEPESPLALTAWAGPLSRRSSDPVVLGATLRDGGQPVSARVSARLAGPDGKGGDPIPLFDDGRHHDGAAGDGEYGARLEETALAPGFWSVRFDAAGEDARGGSFERTSSSGFMSESGAGGLREARATLGSHGLTVSAVADVRIAGRYRLDVIVATTPDAEGRQLGIAWAESPRSLGTGRTPLAIAIPAGSLGDAGKGPLFLDVRLVGLDAPGVSRTTLVATSSHGRPVPVSRP
jgi:hypothetical protein